MIEDFVHQMTVEELVVSVSIGLMMLFAVWLVLVTSTFWHRIAHQHRNILRLCPLCADEMVDGLRRSDGTRQR